MHRMCVTKISLNTETVFEDVFAVRVFISQLINLIMNSFVLMPANMFLLQIYYNCKVWIISVSKLSLC